MGSILLKNCCEKIKYVEDVERQIQIFEIQNHRLEKQRDIVLDSFCKFTLILYCTLLIIFLTMTMSWKSRLLSLITMTILPFSMSCSHCAIKWLYEDRLDAFNERLNELYEEKEEILKGLVRSNNELVLNNTSDINANSVLKELTNTLRSCTNTTKTFCKCKNAAKQKQTNDLKEPITTEN